MNKLRKSISNVLDLILAFVLLCMAHAEGEGESAYEEPEDKTA